MGGLTNKQTSLRASPFRSSAGRFFVYKLYIMRFKKILENAISFVQDPKISHIRNVMPMLSIFGFSPHP